MYLYNSATHKKAEFVTHTPGKVEMYTCGPTVYHFAHNGNLRSYIMEDVLEKYLTWEGYKVNRVMNITDVGHLASDADTGEDKMLKGARREHKTVMEIAQYYTDAFKADCDALNVRWPDTVQPATGCIDEYFGYRYGELEYRSLRFETEVLDEADHQGVAVVNYTDRETPFTRLIEHKHFNFGKQPKTVITREYPATWEKGMRPYYPVNNEKNQALYQQYAALAAGEERVIFGGRLGQYKYYDMDKVVAVALAAAEEELA